MISEIRPYIRTKAAKVLRSLGLQIRLHESYVASSLCNGEGIEVGALSCPARLDNAKSIRYADVQDATQLEKSINKVGIPGLYEGKYVNVDIIFSTDAPPLANVESQSIDFVYSSHSLEHSPNPIATLIDYLRCVKRGGVVYTIIPDKNFTYDRERIATPINKLVEKYDSNDWSYTYEEFVEVFNSTVDHVLYKDTTEIAIRKAFEENSGHHHIYVYTLANVLEIINFVVKKTDAELIYFRGGNDMNIHFAIRRI